MSESYGDRILPRQKVCAKCRSFVTHDKINEKQFACPLCSQRLAAYVDREKRVGLETIRLLVRAEHQRKRKEKQERG